jgi:hypothetical protein
MPTSNTWLFNEAQGGKALEQYKLTSSESHASNLKWVDTLIELDVHGRQQARRELSCTDAEKTYLGGGIKCSRVSNPTFGQVQPSANTKLC